MRAGAPVPGSSGTTCDSGDKFDRQYGGGKNQTAQNKNTQQTQEHQQYEQAKQQHNQQMAEKINPTATDADRMQAASNGAKMADAGVKAGLAVTGLEASAVVGTAVGVSTTVLVASQAVGAVSETYAGSAATVAAGTYYSGPDTVRDFVKGVSTTNPGKVPLTPGGAVGAAVRLVYDQIRSSY